MLLFGKSYLALELPVFTRDLPGGICSSLIGIAATGTSTFEASLQRRGYFRP
jgi:hypothetical protein